MINIDRHAITEPEVGNNWRNEETMKALGSIFFNKCYICEKKKPSPFLLTVDHFIPQNEAPELIYEWSNLYLCCSECNGTRAKRTPTGGYLDPCNPLDDVETEILYELPPYDFNRPVFISATDSPSIKIINTIKQLKQCHYGSKITKIKYESFRNVIAKHANKLIALMLELKNAKEAGNHKMVQIKNNEIEEYLDNDAPFSMLMRNIANRYL